ncbi:MAG: cytochrome c nitrite reductase small subunit [Deltaproteobacteria bacterium]|jgi:cytochrome c nitrite reductase small subunit|nr:cytochrome c nitrite reductase small subunit [Deltaproteobacteria bacterium]
MSLSWNWKQFKFIWLGFGLAGLLVGLTCYVLYASRLWTYAYDDPAACLNCHVMGSYYQSWENGSHRVWAVCNDCHLPNDKELRKYAFKAMDGLYHAAVFTVGAEPQVIRAREGTKEVLLENCLRCHSPLVTEFVKMSPDYETVINGENKACWDCHRDMAHGTVSGLGSNVNVNLPFPDSPVPAWLEKMLN